MPSNVPTESKMSSLLIIGAIATGAMKSMFESSVCAKSCGAAECCRTMPGH